MDRVLREWAPLTDLFSKLPSKVQNGLFTIDLKLTCIDVLPEFLAVGTNFGLVYWYDRKKKTLQKLRCENGHAATTFVKVVSTVDYMVACGSKDGSISIFQIPKSPAESLPESLKPKNKQIERYTVSDLHKSPVSALEWSKNGMKLFSGDKSGNIILTEIDFYMHICKSLEILNESYEVVQLHFYQQMLLVSTTYRSIICKKTDKWKVSQVGKKDRKILGNFGGIIHPNTHCPNDAVIYSIRPGLRIWEADLNGNVLKTLIFKDIFVQPTPEIEVINPIPECIRRNKPQKEKSFGLVLPFNEDSLVIYNNDCLFVLNPKTLTVESVLSSLRNIISVGVTRNEIFVLEGERSLIRLSFLPESIENIPQYPAVIPTANNAFLPLSSSLKELTAKFQTVSIPPLLETVVSNGFKDYQVDCITNAEEAKESPKREQLQKNHNLAEKINETYKKLERLDKAVNEVHGNDNDNILYKHKRHKAKDSETISHSDEMSHITIPTVMSVSTVGILPDLRSCEAIKSDIEEKEKLLADLLCLNTIKINEEALKKCVSSPKEVGNKAKSISNSFNDDDQGTCQKDFDFNKSENVDKKKIQKGDSLSKSIVSYLNKINYSPPQKRTYTHKDMEEKIVPRESTDNDEASNKSINNVPDLINIPFDWKLNRIQVKDEEELLSDTSLADWELL